MSGNDNSTDNDNEDNATDTRAELRNAIRDVQDEYEADQREEKIKSSAKRTVNKVINITIIIFGLIGIIGAGYWLYNKFIVGAQEDDDAAKTARATMARNIAIAKKDIKARTVKQPTEGHPVMTQSPTSFAFVPSPNAITRIQPPGPYVPDTNTMTIESLDEALSAAAMNDGWIRSSSEPGSPFIPNPEQMASFPLLSAQGTFANVLEMTISSGANTKCPANYIYIPGRSGEDRCYKPCKPDEDFKIWRSPVGDTAKGGSSGAYNYYCRKRCGFRNGKPIAMDTKQGFCYRHQERPDFLTDADDDGTGGGIYLYYKNLLPPGTSEDEIYQYVRNEKGQDHRIVAHRSYCGADDDGGERRLIGRYCLSPGQNKKKSPNSWKPRPFVSCPSGYEMSSDKLVCAKCSGDMELRGIYPDYVCVDKCAPGTTDEGTGSALKCYPKDSKLAEEYAM